MDKLDLNVCVLLPVSLLATFICDLGLRNYESWHVVKLCSDFYFVFVPTLLFF
jgi:hypothetical protein